MTMARHPISWYALGSAVILFSIAFGYTGRYEKRQKWRQVHVWKS